MDNAPLVLPGSPIRRYDSILSHHHFAALKPLKHLNLALTSCDFPICIFLGEEKATITEVTSTCHNKRYIFLAQSSLANTFGRVHGEAESHCLFPIISSDFIICKWNYTIFILPLLKIIHIQR